jgi:hypothetical protein
MGNQPLTGGTAEGHIDICVTHPQGVGYRLRADGAASVTATNHVGGLFQLGRRGQIQVRK